MINYNPDVLSCLANLSNDEVFTPPEIANRMLDLLPKDIWSNSRAKFLDPFTKSGVFLREITKRLLVGLADEIPDVQERLDHILHHQVYGMAITELTALVSRRSLYCSKDASCEYSISHFDSAEGNVLFHEIQHTWNDTGKCVYCGASRDVYERGEDKESHAYQFIHTDNPQKLFDNMKFDVIIGNPPYQLNDGGGTGSSANPIYQFFVEQAKKLNPHYLIMIIPSRWFTGGRNALDDFRDAMLEDDSICELHDFPDASECFPGVEIKGGVCYFKRDSFYHGKCKVVSHNHEELDVAVRPLQEKGTALFIRSNKAISILHKVKAMNEKSFSELISANDPFGFDVREEGSFRRVKPTFKKERFKGSVLFYYNGWRKKGIGYIAPNQVKKNPEWINGYKLLIPKAWGKGSGEDKLNPMICTNPACCTETYLIIGPFGSKSKVDNVYSYTQTKFFHFMVSLIKLTQNAMKKVYSFVPLQDFSHPWTDEQLYRKYDLSSDEIAFIESMIRPMD